MKKILLFVLTLCATVTLFAQSFTLNGINYTVTSATTVGVGLNPTFKGAAVIPSSVTYAGVVYSVTSIGASAFYDCTTLTSLTIASSINNIGEAALSNCISMSFT